VTKLTINQVLQQAVDAHKAGHLKEAHRMYDVILNVQPKHPDANHNTGLLTVGLGKIELALPFFKTALEVNPSMAQFWYSYIVALIKLERLTDAKSSLDKAKSKGIKGADFDQLEQKLNDAGAYNNMGTALQKQNRLEEAIEAYKKAIELRPDYAEANNNIGVALQAQNRPEEAIEAYKKAIELRPDDANTYYNMGIALQAQNKLEEAIEAYKKAIVIMPDDANTYYNMGIALQAQNKLEEAIEAYKKAIAIKPDDANTYYNMGIAFKEQGKLEEAVEAQSKAIELRPDYAEAYNNMGIVLQEQGKLDEAVEVQSKAIELRPDYAEVYNNMGTIFQGQGKLEEAVEAYNKALTIKPDYAEVYNNMGTTLQEQGKLEEANEAYNKALTIKPDYAEANRHLSLVTKYNSDNTQINEVKALLQRSDLSSSDRCHLLYTYAKMQEDLGNLSDAFDSYVAGGDLRQKLLAYEFSKDEYMFGQIKKTAPRLKDSSISLSDKVIRHTPIFILGMPRSGTTLVEQVVSSHTQVTGAGELDYTTRFGIDLAIGQTPPDIEALHVFRERYLTELEKKANGQAFVTDKLPGNFAFIALICAAFPEAKIVNVQRNAEATCWSNFKHYFTSQGLGYSCTLADTVKYFRLYRDLMDFWYERYSDRIYNLDYDKLTEDQEPETRRLIGYLQLSWQDACLAPHKNKRAVKTASQQQIRQKIYKGSSQAWRKYEPLLNSVFDGLKP
jgi:tetratricopeptide (TPR) repeat protein